MKERERKRKALLNLASYYSSPSNSSSIVWPTVTPVAERMIIVFMSNSAFADCGR